MTDITGPDIIVRGAGITGLMCAWMLVRRGAKVQVVDPKGVGAGASGGIVGALAPHVPENWNAKKAMQFKALHEAGALWAEVADAGGQEPGYARTGRVQPLSDAAAVALARQRTETAKDLWETRYQWRVIPADDVDVAVESPTGLVIHDTLTARIHPRRACAALASALRALGVEIRPEATCAGVEVWATGADDLIQMSKARGKLVGAPIKGQAALLRADLREAPQVFVDGLHIVPHGDGTVAIGSTTEREFEDATSTDAQLDPLIKAARQAVPALRDAPVTQRWAGLRPRAKSRAPMVGPHPMRKGAYIANGGFKIGLAMAPVMAEMLAALILDETDTIPQDFRPEASF
ncbi:NAD(P)/FAD-dependent oxidoreductase [Jannaschia sp. CCS1]|uniref:NAD(P)/FAD-dependent oxidoreductase n=1 Tax=Jannaschia sp. (strain CCS1) TaxID=290400 RepID=UPI00006BFF68|nr:FAD-dependent oxidoreductase [Jannaschia sp. CCS1]ABD53056.1 FAD dependent oxidoreductase [Jannaschia sp. CCS1]